jgi:hypothetical protein
MERTSLMLASKDYYKARSVLVNNGILPMQQKALPFEPRRDPDFMGAYLMLVLNNEKDDVNIEWRTVLKEDLNQLSSMQQDFVDVSINVLRIRLTISMLEPIRKLRSCFKKLFCVI